MEISPEIERFVSLNDARWRARQQNQVDAINRLLMDSSYDHEMEALHNQLAHLQAIHERIKLAVGPLRVSTPQFDLADAITEIKLILR